MLLKNEDGSCRCSRPPATRSRSSASSRAPRATRAPAAPRSTRPGSTSPSTSCAPPSRTAWRSRSPPGSASAPATDDDSWPPRRSLAARPSMVVVFLGLPAADESEGFDRTHMDLPANQTALLARLAEVNPQTSSSCWPTARRSDCRTGSGTPSAILECWLSGQAAGGAVADLLLGAANPSGRLAETLPLRLEDNPSLPQLPRRGRPRPLRRGDLRRLPRVRRPRPPGQLPLRARPFLHHVRATPTSPPTSPGARRTATSSSSVTGRVTNTGDRGGKEVVQLYVGDPEASVARPAGSLKAFAKVALEPGESHDGGVRGSARVTSPTGRPACTTGCWRPATSRSPSAPPPATCGSPPPSTSPRRPCRADSTAWPRSRSGSPIPPAPPCSARRSGPTRRAGRKGLLGDEELLSRHRQLPDQHPRRLRWLRAHPLDRPHPRRPDLRERRIAIRPNQTPIQRMGWTW